MKVGGEQSSQHQEIQSPESTISRQNKETRLVLQNRLKKVSYASYLIAFILGILISAIYLMIKVEDAISIFDDIYQNWSNNFIVEIYEKQEGEECESQSFSSQLFSYKFPGSKPGCLCENCKDKTSYTIKSLLRGNAVEEDESFFDSLESDDDDRRIRVRRARRRTRRRRRRQLQANHLLDQVTDSEYGGVEESELEAIIDYKIIGKSCSNTKSINKSYFYQDISSVNSQKINYLLGDSNTQINLCIIRSQQRDFFSSNLNNKGKCSEGQIICRGKDSFSFGLEKEKSYSFCIDKDEKCPIRSFHIIPTNQVKETNYVYEEKIEMQNGYTVLISRRKNATMPISEINLYESDGPCIIDSNSKTKWRLSQDNIILNPLINHVQSFKCQIDTRYQPIGFQIQQKYYYDHSQILKNMIESQYPIFLLPQNKVKYDLYYRNYIKFSSSCSQFLDKVKNLGNAINQIESISISISVTSAVLCIFQIVDVVYILYIVTTKPPEVPYPIKKGKIGLIIYSILKYPLAISLCFLDYIILYKMVTCRELGQDIIIRKCTDEITSQQFALMRDSLSFYGIFFHIIICFCFWATDIDFMNLLREYFLLKKAKITVFDEFFSLPKPNENTLIQKKNIEDGVEMQHFQEKPQDSKSNSANKMFNQSDRENEDNSYPNHSKIEQQKSNRSQKMSVQKPLDQEQQGFFTQNYQVQPQLFNQESKKLDQSNKPKEEIPQNQNNKEFQVENDLIKLDEDNSYFE